MNLKEVDFNDLKKGQYLVEFLGDWNGKDYKNYVAMNISIGDYSQLVESNGLNPSEYKYEKFYLIEN